MHTQFDASIFSEHDVCCFDVSVDHTNAVQICQPLNDAFDQYQNSTVIAMINDDGCGSHDDSKLTSSVSLHM